MNNVQSVISLENAMTKETSANQLNLFDSNDAALQEKISADVCITNLAKRKSSAVVFDMQLRRSQARDKEFIRRTKAEVKSYDFA